MPVSIPKIDDYVEGDKRPGYNWKALRFTVVAQRNHGKAVYTFGRRFDWVRPNYRRISALREGRYRA